MKKLASSHSKQTRFFSKLDLTRFFRDRNKKVRKQLVNHSPPSILHVFTQVCN